jgi:hypothetical protein
MIMGDESINNKERRAKTSMRDRSRGEQQQTDFRIERH